jgi:hypothetical protein
MRARMWRILFVFVAGSGAVSGNWRQDEQEPESYILIKKCYELHAPSLKELAEAKGKLDRAVRQFHKYLGEYPPRIAVVIFESSEDMQKFDYSQFRKRSMFFMPWLASRPDETHRRSADLPEEYSDHLSGCGLNHEAGHLFLFAYIEKKFNLLSKIDGGSDLIQSYGHPSIPDWYDEAVAQLCETDRNQKGHISFIKRNLEKRIPFKQFFAMLHPSLKAISELGNHELKEGVKVEHVIRTIEDLDKEIMFYAQSLTVAKFFIERDPDLIRRTAEKLSEGASILQILGDLEDLEKEWVEWVKALKK